MVSVGLQMICMGAAGAPATCVDVAMQSATGAIVSVTETFSAVRTPYFTLATASGGTRAADSHTAAILMALAIGAVCAVL